MTRNESNWSCSLYVHLGHPGGSSTRERLQTYVASLRPVQSWMVIETGSGLVVSFADGADAETFSRSNLESVFNRAVKVARLGPQDLDSSQVVLLQDVPSIVPLEDIRVAFSRQSIPVGAIERVRRHVRVEVLNRSDFEQLLVRGMSFFGVATFVAVRDLRPPSQQALVPFNSSCHANESQDSVIQCYHCQGFWHIAANCRHMPRCVRCGSAHSVEFCSHPRSKPVCCNCGGPHHASYRQCPVRVQLNSATPVKITLSADQHVTNTFYFAGFT